MCKATGRPRTGKSKAGAPSIPSGKRVGGATKTPATALPTFVVHLNLREFADLEEVLEHARSGMVAKGSVFHRDSKRPDRILALVRKRFALVKGLKIEMGSGAGSDRYLIARFAWGGDPDVGGVSAQGFSRSKMGSFNKMGADHGSKVTAYVFEGVVGRWISDYLGSVKVNVDNLFAWVCSHELGHNLGLKHHSSNTNVMYTFSGKGKSVTKSFLTGVSQGGTSFSLEQIQTMQALLTRP